MAALTGQRYAKGTAHSRVGRHRQGQWFNCGVKTNHELLAVPDGDRQGEPEDDRTVDGGADRPIA
jgi:hypothetical protein